MTAEKQLSDNKVYQEVTNSENILPKQKWVTTCLATWRIGVVWLKNNLNISPMNIEKP